MNGLRDTSPSQFSARPLNQGAASAHTPVRSCCAAHGKAAAFLATDDAGARRYIDEGYRLFAYGIDQLMLQAALGAGLAAMRRHAGETT